MPIKPADLSRLVRILSLLGSDQAGERASAALAATRFVTSLGTSWPELLHAEPPKVLVRRVREYGVDPREAADARMRQLRSSNDRLEKEVRALRRRLTVIAEQKRRERVKAELEDED
jgi:hypothetical protein